MLKKTLSAFLFFFSFLSFSQSTLEYDRISSEGKEYIEKYGNREDVESLIGMINEVIVNAKKEFPEAVIDDEQRILDFHKYIIKSLNVSHQRLEDAQLLPQFENYFLSRVSLRGMQSLLVSSINESYSFSKCNNAVFNGIKQLEEISETLPENLLDVEVVFQQLKRQVKFSKYKFIKDPRNVTIDNFIEIRKGYYEVKRKVEGSNPFQSDYRQIFEAYEKVNTYLVKNNLVSKIDEIKSLQSKVTENCKHWNEFYSPVWIYTYGDHEYPRPGKANGREVDVSRNYEMTSDFEKVHKIDYFFYNLIKHQFELVIEKNKNSGFCSANDSYCTSYFTARDKLPENNEEAIDYILIFQSAFANYETNQWTLSLGNLYQNYVLLLNDQSSNHNSSKNMSDIIRKVVLLNQWNELYQTDKNYLINYNYESDFPNSKF